MEYQNLLGSPLDKESVSINPKIVTPCIRKDRSVRWTSRLFKLNKDD